MWCLILMTLLFIIPASQLRIDASGVSFSATDSEEYRDYLSFIESFGTDEYIVLAVQNSLSINDPVLKKRVNRVNEELNSIDSILKVIDLGTMESSSLSRLIRTPHFWDKKILTDSLHIIPGLSRLISKDMKTLAFIVKIDNEKLNGFQLEKKLKQMKQIVVSAFSEYPRCYATGIPVLRAAFERYNLMNALIFGSLGLLFGTLIAFYLFKTIRAGIMVILASLGSLIWTLGIMGSFGIELNLATGLSFGFILIASTTTVFHIVSKYFQLLTNYSKAIALQKTFEIILRPCFMCALTTSAGFLSLTISPVKMIYQAGIIISIGVMMAFLLALATTSFYLPRYFIPNNSSRPKIEGDFADRIVKEYLTIGFKKPIDGIQSVESLTPLIFRLSLRLSPVGMMPEFVFRQLVSKSSGDDMMKSYFDPISKSFRLIIHIKNHSSDQIEAILKQVKNEAEHTFAQGIEITLSGQLIMLRSQVTDLVLSQLKTLFWALFVITILMMLQLKSFVLGLLSLIPNMFPLITIFGLMGWLHIPLDPLTIFAAVISFGLSVDDSIHYLTELKREMMYLKKDGTVHECLSKAYYKTSRALVSTTAVLFLSAVGLLFSSFQHVFSLGLLISSASITALVGDLIFMPAIVVVFEPLSTLLSSKLKT